LVFYEMSYQFEYRESFSYSLPLCMSGVYWAGEMFLIYKTGNV